MKRYTPAIAIVSTLLVVVGLMTWLYAYFEIVDRAKADQSVTSVSKYDVGPPDAQEMFELTNMEREKHGVAPLAYDNNLGYIAQWKTDHMVENDYFAHYLPGTDKVIDQARSDLYPRDCTGGASEILVNGGQTSRDTVESWMSSERHKAAILNPHAIRSGLGLTLVTSGEYADTYKVAQHFCKI